MEDAFDLQGTIQEEIQFENCNFTANLVKGGAFTQEVAGGAINLKINKGNVTINSCNFENQSATSQGVYTQPFPTAGVDAKGGAIRIQIVEDNALQVVVIKGKSKFTNNSVTGGDSTTGGAGSAEGGAVYIFRFRWEHE